MSDVKRYLRFDVLDGLRGVAALIVVALHAAQSLREFSPYLVHAHLAVDFFFCLSGFVLSLSYSKRLQTSMSMADFLVRRVIRLGPMVAMGTLIATIAYAVKLAVENRLSYLPDLLTTALLNIFFLPSPLLHDLDHGSGYLPNPPIWSLTAEMVASFVFAAVLIRLSTLRVGLVTLLGAVGLGLVARNLGQVDLGWQWSTLWVGEVRVWFSFSAGVLIHRIWHQNRGNLPLLHANYSYAMVVAVASSLLWPFGKDQTWLVEYFLVVAVFPSLVFIALLLQTAGGQMAWLAWLGEVSFPIYATHYGVLRIFGPIRSSPLMANHGSVMLILELMGCTMVAWLLLRYFDLPVRSYLSSSIERRTVGRTFRT